MKKNINKNFTKISLELTKTLNNDEKKIMVYILHHKILLKIILNY